MNAPLQIFGSLPSHIEAAMRASMERFGVLIPIAVDQDGRIIDGHHRKRLSEELGIKCPSMTIKVETEYEALEIAETLNSDRRQMTEEMRKEVAADLRAKGHSVRAIAGALNVGKSTVDRDLAQVSRAGHLEGEPTRVTGTDGKSYSSKPARSKKKPTGNAKSSAKKPATGKSGSTSAESAGKGATDFHYADGLRVEKAQLEEDIKHLRHQVAELEERLADKEELIGDLQFSLSDLDAIQKGDHAKQMAILRASVKDANRARDDAMNDANQKDIQCKRYLKELVKLGWKKK